MCIGGGGQRQDRTGSGVNCEVCMLRRPEGACNQAVGVVRTGPRLIPALLDRLGAKRSCQETNPGRRGNWTISNLSLAGLGGIFIPLSAVSGAEVESGNSGKRGFPAPKAPARPPETRLTHPIHRTRHVRSSTGNPRSREVRKLVRTDHTYIRSRTANI
jgi:hypothetical protein